VIAPVDVGPGPDGRLRCWWCLGAPEYLDYHDREWGRPLRGDVAVFELLTLEAFQSGLSWLTILRKRDAFRRAFDGFEIERVADYDDRQVQRLLGDASIVRNRAKIEATVRNAQAARRLQDEGGSLTELLWSFAPDPGSQPVPASGADLQSTTAESKDMARELKRRGFAFVGPTTAQSFMQGAGLVNDHLAACEFRGAD
jgi:DNA-3-methyladenine glycosylase I